MGVTIKDIAYFLPENTVTNQDLHEENPTWIMGLVEERAGVMKRHIARDNETALDLSFKACQQLFSKNEDARSRIDGIIFCTQSQDYILPPNSCILHKMLDLPENVFALDINSACSGYVYGFALAQGLILSGINKNILLVNADTYSKYIHKQDRSARVLFGDGAAVTWVTASDSAKGIIDIQCATSGKDYDKFIIPAGGCRTPKSAETNLPTTDGSGNVRTLENIRMDGLGILVFVNSKVPRQIQDILARNKLTIDDIDLFVFHQASKMVLDSLVRLLRIKPEKEFRNLQHIGNTVSASIPMALKDAMNGGRIAPGDKVLICGFGVGLSWGTAIIEF
jgi:3-oxoacyl-[acyl-carrier-protein] synthase-3